jgi:hypothetical protein
MSISVAPIQGFSMTSIQPLNYVVRNQAMPSDAYVNAVQERGNSRLVDPVGYPTAKRETVEVPGYKQAREADAANEAYEQTLSLYRDSNTGYSASGFGTGYTEAAASFNALA